jgi:hypothetical protein
MHGLRTSPRSWKSLDGAHFLTARALAAAAAPSGTDRVSVQYRFIRTREPARAAGITMPDGARQCASVSRLRCGIQSLGCGAIAMPAAARLCLIATTDAGLMLPSLERRSCSPI